MRVYPTLGQLLDESLGLIEGEELCDADTHEGGQGGVTELLIDLSNKFRLLDDTKY